MLDHQTAIGKLAFDSHQTVFYAFDVEIRIVQWRIDENSSWRNSQ